MGELIRETRMRNNLEKGCELNNIESGIYFLTMTAGAATVTKKVVVTN
jgi:hypothetical protein